MPIVSTRRTTLAALSCLALAALSGSPAAAADLKTVVSGQLTVAYRTDDKPVSFIENGKPTGYIVEFAQAIGKELGKEVEFVSTNFESMVPAVKNEQYDTAAFGVLVTPEREAMVDFTTPVGYGEARLVSRKEAPIDKVQAAGGKTVAVTRGSALIPLLNKIAPDVTVREFPNVAASLNALLAGQVDGLFTGLATADRLVQQQAELMASQAVTSGIAAFPVAKTNPELLKALDDAIDKLMKDGTYTRLWTKWNPPSVEIPEDMYAEYPGMPHPEQK
ncbi:ABC transporter substrate-binding protein [Mangrovibrevibacter kandeliae]|uniref:ABC transporter substrate-binding protein n=1 Tax=Mangrovibrevibacter kandeliae TaxID=2968473 RepID=UPI002118E76D|nr:ABC transporter substrate-binding protein [Aurantimonas sp. CSK15Z-1]MCQ8782400.1 ABC transporter substrate-binding protein [Aurantimonas sp. CSK15Z-1]